MGGTKPALSSFGVLGGLIAVLAGVAPLIGYKISPDDQAAMVNLIQSGVTVVSAVASIIGGAVAVWGRVRATKEIQGVVSAAPGPRALAFAVAAILLATALTACQGPAQPAPVAVSPAAAPEPSGGNTACAVLRWAVPIAVGRLPDYGPQGKAIVADAQALVAAGCRAADATWQQRAAAAAAALVDVLWARIAG